MYDRCDCCGSGQMRYCHECFYQNWSDSGSGICLEDGEPCARCGAKFTKSEEAE
jgi:hypothetical protein